MGLIKNSEYISQTFGLKVPTAYAQIVKIIIENDNIATATFHIQQTREDIFIKQPIDVVKLTMQIDKSQPIYEQLYNKSKQDYFLNTVWKDDIV